MNDYSNQRGHISAQFSRELEGVQSELLNMGGLVQSQIEKAVDATLEGDSLLAEEAIDLDTEVNALERSIDEQCARILALRQPAAGDLRLVLAVIKVTTDLERIGDEAVKIGRQAILLSEGGAHDETGIKVRSIAMRVNTMLKAALDSFARLHTEGALSVILTDDDIDEAYLDAREWLVEFVEDQPETLRASMAYLWILKSLERVGDNAANIAEQVIYLTRGLDVRHLDSAKVRDLVS